MEMVPKSPQSPLRMEDIILKIGTLCVFVCIKAIETFCENVQSRNSQSQVDERYATNNDQGNHINKWNIKTAIQFNALYRSAITQYTS
jgi:hypothetical protein